MIMDEAKVSNRMDENGTCSKDIPEFARREWGILQEI
jgi:hypothetical protein